MHLHVDGDSDDDHDHESSGDDHDDEKVAKLKVKMFQSNIFDKKTQNPHWNYSFEHILNIDDVLINKL